MQVHEKIAILERLKDENELRVELVIPLLRKMGHFSEVLDNQGPNEAGVDVIGVSTSPFTKPEYTAFILKKGKITLASADKKNNLVMIVETQVTQAQRQPLSHPRLQDERSFASRFVVLADGSISNQAESALRSSFKDLNIDFIAQDRLINLIDEHWPEFYEDRRPFLSTYAKKLLDSLNIVDLELLGYSKARKTLSDIYIDALLNERDNISNHDFVIDKEPIHGAKLCDLRKNLIVVTSGPGGGKSTLLKEIAITQSQANKNRVAVYMHARDILASTDVIDAAAVALSRMSSDRLEVILGEMRDQELLLLVDGLDELASTQDREKVIGRLKTTSENNAIKVILGSRPESNPGVLAALSDFSSYSISPLRYGQIRSFFGKWFNSTDKAAKLLEAMQDKGVMDKLPRTPMTMTLVAIVFESKEDLPANLTELYQMFVELLTGKWDTGRQIASTFDSPMKIAFLSFLAWKMHSERLEAISHARALDFAREFYMDQATISGVDPVSFIQDIIDRSQIVIPLNDDTLRFSHMTFQEFFAAEYISQQAMPDDLVLSWYGDDWWSEVLFFWAGKRKNIASVVGELLKADYSSPDSRMTKFVTLGSMLQAGVLTNYAEKRAAIDFASRGFIKCYDDLINAIDSMVKGRVRAKYSRVLLLDFLQSVFSSNFTSKYLREPLQDVFAEMMKAGDPDAARFFLASALQRIGDDDALLDFASDPKMIDTSMYLISHATLAKKDASYGYRQKYKKLEKRKEIFRKAIKKEFQSVLNTEPKPPKLPDSKKGDEGKTGSEGVSSPARSLT